MCGEPEFTVVDRCRYCGTDLPTTRRRAVEYADHMTNCDRAPGHVRVAMREYLNR